MCLSGEGVVDAGGVCVAVVVDDSDLCICKMLGNVLGGSGALVGVVEADLIGVVLVSGDIGGRSRGGQGEDTIQIGLSGNSNTRSGGNAAAENLHTPVHEVVVSVDGLFCVVLVVLSVELNLEAAHSVDLVNRDLSAVLCSSAINGSATGQGTDKADLQSVAGSGSVCVVVSRCVVCLSRLAGVAAGNKQTGKHNQNEYEGYDFLHFSFSPFICKR